MDTALSLKLGTSRARDTYGYNIVTLTDTRTGKRYRCMGGGYDMVGTVFADWLEETFQDELKGIADRAHAQLVKSTGDRPYDRTTNEDGLYGMTAIYTAKMTSVRISLDGGCGLESIKRVAKAIGLTVRTVPDRRGNPEGFIVTDNR